jgi:hypothetical protein
MRPGNLDELRRLGEALNVSDLPDSEIHSTSALIRPVHYVKSRRKSPRAAHLVAIKSPRNRRS